MCSLTTFGPLRARIRREGHLPRPLARPQRRSHGGGGAARQTERTARTLRTDGGRAAPRRRGALMSRATTFAGDSVLFGPCSMRPRPSTRQRRACPRCHRRPARCKSKKQGAVWGGGRLGRRPARAAAALKGPPHAARTRGLPMRARHAAVGGPGLLSAPWPAPHAAAPRAAVPPNGQGRPCERETVSPQPPR